MIRFLSGLTFLYAFTIVVLIIFGIIYYRNFSRGKYTGRFFPWVFLFTGLAGFYFLYINFNASLDLRTFTNTDHHFIRHDGFQVTGSIELGKTDTVHFNNNKFNRFVFSKTKDKVAITSGYSEEPFYSSKGGAYRLLSVHFPAVGHQLSFVAGNAGVLLRSSAGDSFELFINNKPVSKVSRQVKRGSTIFNLLKDDPAFISSEFYTNEKLVKGLQQLYVLRNDLRGNSLGDLEYFVSGKAFSFLYNLTYDKTILTRESLSFSTTIEENDFFTWGIGFIDNNRNQYRVGQMTGNSFRILNRYPVSYPLSQHAGSNEFNEQIIRKFLVADESALVAMLPVFNEGFLFPAFPGDSSVSFDPVLLTYQQKKGNTGIELGARFLANTNIEITPSSGSLLLPSATKGFEWIFTVNNSFYWQLGKWKLSPGVWQSLVFGSLGVFFIVILLSSIYLPLKKLSWIWQLLAVVSFILLVTRFFLYWRYKSFPPYESVDLPSMQQLNSPWNFGIIILATLLFSIIFGWGLFRHAGAWLSARGLVNVKPSLYNRFGKTIDRTRELVMSNRVIRSAGAKGIYFISWFAVILLSFGYSALSGFDSTANRHIAIFLILAYFLFLWISYRYSPLVVTTTDSWWKVSTSRFRDLVFSNPVKLILSVSLLALFSVVDIGFAIIFLNFLLFNEAFLCINYGIAGLSAGSRKNAGLFAFTGIIYLVLFILNLVYGPYLYRALLEMPMYMYMVFYFLFAAVLAYCVRRVIQPRRQLAVQFAVTLGIFLAALVFFPKNKILEKAGMTKYRIDVMSIPTAEAIENAYNDGKSYEPVIRAAQNQWFINTFIHKDNNPGVNHPQFNMLPHAPQSKGVKYNAQATDLVASRFLLAEHGRWAILLYVLLLLLPASLLAFFYKLYPDFTNRVNDRYPYIATGFSILNYLVISALLVILAATGRYIFFGQDLPFASILSKQSVLFPALLVITTLILFRNLPPEQYLNRKKLIPGALVFAGLAFLLFFLPPVFNKEKQFTVDDLEAEFSLSINSKIQPLLELVDTSSATRRLPASLKDSVFTSALRSMIREGGFAGEGKFFQKELSRYANSTFSQHLDQRRLLFLDMHSGSPKFEVNRNFFRVQPPPHLQEYWSGNVYGDTTMVSMHLWDNRSAKTVSIIHDLTSISPPSASLGGIHFSQVSFLNGQKVKKPALVNLSGKKWELTREGNILSFNGGDTVLLSTTERVELKEPSSGTSLTALIEPSIFMRNLLVNGSRYYVYPRGRDFIWARNFSEAVSGSAKGNTHVFISVNADLHDHISSEIRNMMDADSAYGDLSEYAITIADGNGRLIAFPDHIKSFDRPDPNSRLHFNSILSGDIDGFSQSKLRKQVGNLNFLRLNPGPGSTLKPLVFAAVASQLNIDWNSFSSQGFSEKQEFFGGEKVGLYDFEKNNGTISKVSEYLKYSDNYYHSNILLLGSYPSSEINSILSGHFTTLRPGKNFHWPYFNYSGKQYFLDRFSNWPGFQNGKASLGSDSSSLNKGLLSNFMIFNRRAVDLEFATKASYDSMLFHGRMGSANFVLPEYPLFDQQGTGMDMRKPKEVFISSFRGHVKGSSQVMISPVTMVNAFGKLVSQNRNYTVTLDPYAQEKPFEPFLLGPGVTPQKFLSLIRGEVFRGMKDVLSGGTATALGNRLKGSPYFYFAKTGTTGDDDRKTKSKLFTIIISKEDLSSPGYNFRNNKFYTVYFTSQNGPVKQNEEFQASIIRLIENSAVFKRYMEGD